MKPVLFVDIDGVVADSVSWWIQLHNLEYGTQYTIEDVTDYFFNRCRVPFWTMEKYYRDYTGVNPIPGAFDALERLQRFYRIVYATSGFGSEWLKDRVPGAEIVTLKDKSLLRGFALIDDYPLNLDVFQGERFLLSQPWNRGRGLNETTWPIISHYLEEVAHEVFGAAR